MADPKKIRVEIEFSIYPPESLMLRHHVGEGNDGTTPFTMEATMAMEPIVEREGRRAMLPWQAIVAAALEALRKC